MYGRAQTNNTGLSLIKIGNSDFPVNFSSCTRVNLFLLELLYNLRIRASRIKLKKMVRSKLSREKEEGKVKRTIEGTRTTNETG